MGILMSLQIGKQLGREEEDRSTGMEAVAGNEDLLTLILLCLPVRSLLRFKSVSKHWLSLISNPQFCLLKSKLCFKRVSGLLLKPSDTVDTLRFDFVPLDRDYPAPIQGLDFLDGVDTRGFEPLQFCNGLLLIHTKRQRYSFTDSTHPEIKCFVINLTTKQRTTVSLPMPAGKAFRFASVGLAFDPRKSLHFKLICLFLCRGDDLTAADYCVRVYSSETGLMTQFSDIFHSSCDCLLSDCLYWNGAINWTDYSSDGLYYNVDEERFGILPLVPYCGSGINYYGESNDHLFLVQTNTISATEFDVYEMDREYKGWFVSFHVDLQPIFRAIPSKLNSLHDAFSILAIVDKDDGESSFIVFSIHGKAVIRFHLKDGVFAKICDFSGVNAVGYLPYYWTESIQFIESLHPL